MYYLIQDSPKIGSLMNLMAPGIYNGNASFSDLVWIGERTKLGFNFSQGLLQSKDQKKQSPRTQKQTPPKTNMPPKKQWLGKHFPVEMTLFRGHVSFRGSILWIPSFKMDIWYIFFMIYVFVVKYFKRHCVVCVLQILSQMRNEGMFDCWNTTSMQHLGWYIN